MSNHLFNGTPNPDKKTILSFTPFPIQEKIINSVINDPHKFYCLNLSRQIGKTLLTQNLMMYFGINNPNSEILFCSNNFKAAKKVYVDFIETMEGSGIIKSLNRTSLELTLCNGTRYYFRSGQRPDSNRGPTYSYAFLDEFAFCKEGLWPTLRPALAVKGQKIIFTSTPNGLNFFHEIYQRGVSDKPEDKLYKSFTANCYENPFFTQEEIDDARMGMPLHIFQAEYEAKFLSDGSSAFKNIDECVYGHINKYSDYGKVPGKKYFVGIDLGRVNDKTVCVVMDENKTVVDIYRAGEISWQGIITGLANIINKWKPIHGFIEVNSIGDVVYDELVNRHGIRVLKAAITSHNSKQNIIEDLQLEFDKKRISIPDEPYFISELRTFSYNYDKQTRKVKMGARSSNYNDDCVIALAYALASHKEVNPTQKRFHWAKL